MSDRRKRFTDDGRPRKTLESVAFGYGLRGGIVLIFIFLVMYYFHSENEYIELLGKRFWYIDLGVIKYLNLPVIFYAIYKGTMIFKIRHNFASISYKKSVISGAIIAITCIVIVAIFSIIFYKFIDPTLLNLTLEKHYLNPNTTKVARAINFLRPYEVTFIISILYTLLISLHLKKTEHSH